MCQLVFIPVEISNHFLFFFMTYVLTLFFVHGFHFRGVNLSESEAEQDGDHNITELPQVYSGRGNMASQQSAVRLTEVSRLYRRSI